MCIEDLRLGRRRVTGMRVAATDTSVLEVAPANSRRVAIGFEWANAAETVRLATDFNPTAAQGIRLSGTQPFRYFTVEEHGDMVMRQWRSFGDSGQTALTVIEVWTEDT